MIETAAREARDKAETGAKAILGYLGATAAAPPNHLNEAQLDLRERLRLHGEQLGDSLDGGETQAMVRLVEETAYEHWHRMLFA
ncbi:MAG: hypothetical protein LBQ12_01230, partial [Deltaproteobacteria bacterium]|nr:hypothetical protein [Deltaproteobacteria bacterium]